MGLLFSKSIISVVFLWYCLSDTGPYLRNLTVFLFSPLISLSLSLFHTSSFFPSLSFPLSPSFPLPLSFHYLFLYYFILLLFEPYRKYIYINIVLEQLKRRIIIIRTSSVGSFVNIIIEIIESFVVVYSFLQVVFVFLTIKPFFNAKLNLLPDISVTFGNGVTEKSLEPQTGTWNVSFKCGLIFNDSLMCIISAVS